MILHHLSIVIALLSVANTLPNPLPNPQPADDPSRTLNYLPHDGLYTEIYRGNTTTPQAWGAYVDKTDITLSTSALATLANACFSPMNALCRWVADHAADPANRKRWVWAMSYGPGCVAGVYIPADPHVPDPNYSQCRAYIDDPMRLVLDQAATQGNNRVSVNLDAFPTLPDLKDLIKTTTQGAIPSTDDRGGSAVDETITSWMLQAYVWTLSETWTNADDP